MLPTTGSSFGDVVLVRFPFTDQAGAKQRPAMVVSSAAHHRARPDRILLAITSQIKPKPGFGQACIQDWQGAGLLKPSVLKPILFTTEKTLIRKTLGRLQTGDQSTLRKVIKTIIG